MGADGSRGRIVARVDEIAGAVGSASGEKKG
jgi:hypothetical protein